MEVPAYPISIEDELREISKTLSDIARFIWHVERTPMQDQFSAYQQHRRISEETERYSDLLRRTRARCTKLAVHIDGRQRYFEERYKAMQIDITETDDASGGTDGTLRSTGTLYRQYLVILTNNRKRIQGKSGYLAKIKQQEASMLAIKKALRSRSFGNM